MNEIGLLYQPRDMGITRADLTASLLHLRAYVESRADLWYTVISQSQITPEWIDQALTDMEFYEE